MTQSQPCTGSVCQQNREPALSSIGVAGPRRRLEFWDPRGFPGSRDFLEDVNRVPISNETEERCKSQHETGNEEGNRVKAAKPTGPEFSPDDCLLADSLALP